MGGFQVSQVGRRMTLIRKVAEGKLEETGQNDRTLWLVSSVVEDRWLESSLMNGPTNISLYSLKELIHLADKHLVARNAH